jgi:N-acetylmuramoyl-L-alanine amidase
MSVIPATAEDCETLAKTVWGEARGEDWPGQIQIAQVVINRLKSGKWFGGRSVTEVCRRPFQFSCWNADDPNRPLLARLTLDDPAYQRGMCAALHVIQGLAPRTQMGAAVTHYYRDGMPVPDWAQGRPRAFAIGHHNFFRGIA